MFMHIFGSGSNFQFPKTTHTANGRGMKAAKINHVSLNSSHDAFAAATDNGVRLFNIKPLVLMRSLSKDFVGSVSLCTILHRSNLILFVGSSNSKLPNNTVFVWDEKLKEIVLEIAVTGGSILNVLVSYTRLVIVQQSRIHIFQFPNPCKLLRTEEIRLNPKGLASMSSDHTNQNLVFPGFKLGSVRIVKVNQVTDTASLAPYQIDAHQNEIAQMNLNNQGTLLATGSIKGTVIRVFDTRTNRLLFECRRGTDPASLHCLQFSPCSEFLAVTSDKGTIHVFGCRNESDGYHTSKRSLLQQIVSVKGERRSIAQVSLEPRVMSVGFRPSNCTSMQTLVALCQDGTYHKFSFGIDNQPLREGFDYFMQLGDEQEFWTQPF